MRVKAGFAILIGIPSFIVLFLAYQVEQWAGVGVFTVTFAAVMIPAYIGIRLLRQKPDNNGKG